MRVHISSLEACLDFSDLFPYGSLFYRQTDTLTYTRTRSLTLIYICIEISKGAWGSPFSGEAPHGQFRSSSYPATTALPTRVYAGAPFRPHAL